MLFVTFHMVYNEEVTHLTVIERGIDVRMKHNRKVIYFMMLVSFLMVLAACGTKAAPKEAVQQAMTASLEMKSYTFSGSLAIDELDLPAEMLEGADPAMLDMVKNASMNIEGVFRQDPMQMEMTLALTIPGDMAFTVKTDMVMTEDKLYVKVPNIPMLPLGEATGKFVVIDPKALAEETGTPMPEIDLDKQRAMSQEMAGVLFKHFDEEQYFEELKKGDVAGLPAGIDPDRVVKFYVTQETFEPMIMTIVDKVAPELIDLIIANDDYLATLQLTKEELEQAKEELAAGDRGELREALEEFKQSVKVNDLSLTTAIQGEFPVYQAVKVNMDVTQDGQTAGFGLTFTSQYGNINKDVEFKIGIPEDALTIDELSQMFMAPAL